MKKNRISCAQRPHGSLVTKLTRNGGASFCAPIIKGDKVDLACKIHDEIIKRLYYEDKKGRETWAPKHKWEDNIKMHLDGYERVANSNEDSRFLSSIDDEDITDKLNSYEPVKKNSAR